MDIIEQHEDVWSRIKTVHGYAVDEVRSVLQKSIRRGLVEEAILAAFELYVTGPETEELLWRRLEIITIEDVGTGMVDGPILIEALNNQRLRWPRSPERWMFSAHDTHAVRRPKRPHYAGTSRLDRGGGKPR
jgi:hypothetical protein